MADVDIAPSFGLELKVCVQMRNLFAVAGLTFALIRMPSSQSMPGFPTE